jgi:transposase-like protein
MGINMSNNKDRGEKSDEGSTDVSASFTCAECGKTFNSRQELKEHTH